MRSDPESGAKMAQARRESNMRPAGRPPLRSKYKRQIDAVKRTFAGTLPGIAGQYIAELSAKALETCPEHRKVLRCPECDYHSQRVDFDHRAAAYALARLMGKPTTRSEDSISVRLVEQLSQTVVMVFTEVNLLEDRDEQQAVFARRLIELDGEEIPPGVIECARSGH